MRRTIAKRGGSEHSTVPYSTLVDDMILLRSRQHPHQQQHQPHQLTRGKTGVRARESGEGKREGHTLSLWSQVGSASFTRFHAPPPLQEHRRESLTNMFRSRRSGKFGGPSYVLRSFIGTAFCYPFSFFVFSLAFSPPPAWPAEVLGARAGRMCTVTRGGRDHV